MSRNDHNYRPGVIRTHLLRFQAAWGQARDLDEQTSIVKLYIETAVGENDTHLLGAIFNAFPPGENRNSAVRYLCQKITAAGNKCPYNLVRVTLTMLAIPAMRIDCTTRNIFSPLLVRLLKNQTQR